MNPCNLHYNGSYVLLCTLSILNRLNDDGWCSQKITWQPPMIEDDLQDEEPSSNVINLTATDPGDSLENGDSNFHKSPDEKAVPDSFENKISAAQVSHVSLLFLAVLCCFPCLFCGSAFLSFC